jgi:uncharacterized protein involved in response to NO
MATSAEKIRAYRGPAILSYGFRPLFLMAGIWAAFSMLLWIALLAGAINLPSAFDMFDWHVHELLFGYLPAVAAGFLLTAVPNWTGRLPVTGTPLLLLVLVWLAGRLAVFFSGLIGPVAAAGIDLSFLAALGLLIGREIVAGSNWRNLKVLGLIALLFCANALFHVEAAAGSARASGYGLRAGVAAAILLIMVIGGRIIPSFTHNWLARRGPGRLPASFNRLDMAMVLAAAASLALWIALPLRPETAVAMLLAGLLHLWRLWRWAGFRTAAEPLVWILHVGYACVPLGFLLNGLAILWPDTLQPAAALHAWTAGAVGLMTLAVMTRASLGHTGHALLSTPGISAVYVCIIVSVAARIVAGFGIATDPALYLAGTLWIAGFGGFTLIYAPMLLRPRG